MDEFTNKPKKDNIKQTNKKLKFVTKTITNNDIRCNIISLPRFIFEKIDNNTEKKKIKLCINENEIYGVTFVPIRNYIYLNTKILKKYNLIMEDGTFNETEAKFAIDKEIIYINMNF